MDSKLTRAEAICACNNIQALAESMQEMLTDKGAGDYVTSRYSTAEDMQGKFVSGFNPSIKQSAYIRKMWDGLRRWDRQNEHPSDMFHGLAEIEREMGAATRAKSKAPPKRGVETASAPHADAPPDTMYNTPQEALPEGQPPAGSMYAESPESTEEEPMPDFMLSNDEGGWLTPVLECVATTTERQHEITRLQMEASNNRHVDHKDVQHGNITHVLSLTASERTKDLIRAAEICGKVSATVALSSNLEEALEDLRKRQKRG